MTAPEKAVGVDVLGVFTDEHGGGGNLLGVVMAGAAVPPGKRQALAAELGYSETVYVDGGDRVAIFTPKVELPFAGHPLVGAAWLMARHGSARATLRTGAGDVPVSHRGVETFITGRPEWTPQFELVEFGSPEEVDALRGPPPGHDLLTAWSWIDADEGTVRVRVFPVRFGIDEDEATGANAILMAGSLGRRLLLRQGVASRICAAPVGDGYVEVGGFVRYVQRKSVSVPDTAQSTQGDS